LSCLPRDTRMRGRWTIARNCSTTDHADRVAPGTSATAAPFRATLRAKITRKDPALRGAASGANRHSTFQWNLCSQLASFPTKTPMKKNQRTQQSNKHNKRPPQQHPVHSTRQQPQSIRAAFKTSTTRAIQVSEF
jgi:hypothetical protein